MVWFLIILIASIVLLIFLAAMVLRWQIFISVTCKVSDNAVLLTFDDGPHPEFTSKVLDLLRDYEVKAAFFLVGDRVKKCPDVVRKIEANGHIIGNHSYAHSISNTFSSSDAVKSDLLACSKAIEKITGEKPEWYRPPFGVTNPSIASAIKRTGMKVMGWSLRSYDTLYKDSNKLSEFIIHRSKPGDIILLHDDRKQTLEALPLILRGLKEKGLI
jgi:peptidoglycan/xylan/chitin deacetylase (PgdA/CDA1 family)